MKIKQDKSSKRHSIRLQKYDYSSEGIYFVTVCTYEKKCFFGDITNGTMVLNDIGMIIKDQWLFLPSIFPNIKLDEYIIMPNHIHGIICMKNNVCEIKLGRIIGAFKSLCVKYVLCLYKQKFLNKKIGTLWQRNYYDHIIRNEFEYYFVQEYIMANPSQWRNVNGRPQGSPLQNSSF